MYKLTPTQTIIRSIDGACIPIDAANSDYAAYQAWLAAGNTPIPVAAPAPSVEANTAAIQAALDAKARERGYDDIKSACSYAAAAPVVPADCPELSTCERFRAEGNALQAWMALTWAMAYAYIGNPENAIPSVADAVAMIPDFSWPE